MPIQKRSMDDFFRHENLGSPPSLSDMEELGQCTNAHHSPQSPAADAKILDGAVIVNMLLPESCATFGVYAEQVFISNIQPPRCGMGRYINNSLKSSAGQKRGSGNCVRVKGSTPFPKNSNSFLRVDENKSELYQYLSQCICPLKEKISNWNVKSNTYRERKRAL